MNDTTTVDYPFAFLKGRTLASIDGAVKHSDSVIFTCTDGTVFKMHHHQDCCEQVSLEDVVGEVSALIGSPILMAEESMNTDDPLRHVHESSTWTFYKLATVNGSVTLRWYGTSNGYYSERASFSRIIPADEYELRRMEAECWDEDSLVMLQNFMDRVQGWKDVAKHDAKQYERMINNILNPTTETIQRAYDAFWNDMPMRDVLQQSLDVRNAFAKGMAAAFRSAEEHTRREVGT